MKFANTNPVTWQVDTLARVRSSLAANPGVAGLENALDVIRRAYDADRAWLDFPCDPAAPSFLVAVEACHPDFPGSGSAQTPIPMSPGMQGIMARALATNTALSGPGENPVEGTFDSARRYAVRARLWIAIGRADEPKWLFGLHQCRDDRDWSPSEHELFEQLGEMLGRHTSVNVLMVCMAKAAKQRARAEAALADSETRFREFAATAADWFWESDENHIVTYAAGKAPHPFEQVSALLGHQRFDVDPNSMSAADHEPHLADLSARAAFQAVRISLWHTNGTRGTSVLHGRPRFDEAGKFLGYRGTGHDITAEAAREAREAAFARELRQSQKLQSLGELTGGVAHDFNNLLTIIIGHGELAAESLTHGDAGKTKASLREVMSAGERGRALVTQMLTFSRGGTGTAAATDVGTVIDDSVRMLSATLPATIELFREPPTTRAVTFIDPIQLMQIVTNICINARDACIGHQGTIQISQQLSHVNGRYCASCHKVVDGEFIAIRVKDDGQGIDPAKLERVFQPFFSTKGPGRGSGMGLAVVHGIVHDSGGHILVETEPGLGTTVEVLLPSTDLLPLKAPVPPGSPSDRDSWLGTSQLGSEGRARILFVDDELPICRFVAQSLEAYRFRVSVTTDARAAEALLLADPHALDLIITDQTMPEMTGLELLRCAHSLRPDLPVIVCSGYSDQVDEVRARGLGAAAFLAKPFDMHELVDCVEKVLKDAGFDDAAGHVERAGIERDASR